LFGHQMVTGILVPCNPVYDGWRNRLLAWPHMLPCIGQQKY
jgi:hypothetical protein